MTLFPRPNLLLLASVYLVVELQGSSHARSALALAEGFSFIIPTSPGGATATRSRNVSPPIPVATTNRMSAAAAQQASQTGAGTLPINRNTQQQDRPHHLEAPTSTAKIYTGSAQCTRFPRCRIPNFA